MKLCFCSKNVLFQRSVNESGHNSWLSDMHRYSQIVMRLKKKKKFEEKNQISKPATLLMCICW